MRSRRLLLSAVTVFAVIAAGVYAQVSSQRRIEALQVQSNRLIDEVEASKRELNSRFGITLTPLVETVPASARARDYAWGKLSVTERKIALRKLLQHVELVGRVFELTAQDGLRLEGGADELRKSADAAWRFYRAGKDFKSRLAVKSRRSHRAGRRATNV